MHSAFVIACAFANVIHALRVCIAACIVCYVAACKLKQFEFIHCMFSVVLRDCCYCARYVACVMLCSSGDTHRSNVARFVRNIIHLFTCVVYCKAIRFLRTAKRRAIRYTDPPPDQAHRPPPPDVAPKYHPVSAFSAPKNIKYAKKVCPVGHSTNRITRHTPRIELECSPSRRNYYKTTP